MSNDLYIDPGVVSKPGQLDALLREHAPEDQLAIHVNDGVFDTASTLEWGDTNDVNQNRGFLFGRNWTMDSETNATIRWNVDAVPDEVISDYPQWLLCSTQGRFKSIELTPDECWALLPVGQRVRGVRFDLQFDKAAPRWKAAGHSLRIGAGLLSGHQAAFERCHATNFGALSAENFPFYIQAGVGMYDRNLIAQTDPATHILDDGVPDEQCAHITKCTLDGYAAGATDGAQVSCAFIEGNTGERTPGEWVQHWRKFAYADGNSLEITDPRPNMVQLITLYQTLRGRVTGNSLRGNATALYYGDTYGSRGIEIDGNESEAYYGVQLVLSPTGVCPEQFFHEGYTIGARNRFKSRSGFDVKLDTLAAKYEKEHASAVPSTRYIRGIAVHESLTVQASEDARFTRFGATPPQVLATRGGCRFNPFGR